MGYAWVSFASSCTFWKGPPLRKNKGDRVGRDFAQRIRVGGRSWRLGEDNEKVSDRGTA